MEWAPEYSEGDIITEEHFAGKGTAKLALASVHGPVRCVGGCCWLRPLTIAQARCILLGERTALNIMARASGIATRYRFLILVAGLMGS